MISIVRKWRRRVAFNRLRKLAKATTALYNSQTPFEPLKQVNQMQRAFQLTLPFYVRWIIPKNIRSDGGLRLQEIIHGHSSATWVQESIMASGDESHQAGIIAPPSLFSKWWGPVDKKRSWFLFLFFIFRSFITGIKRYCQLCAHSILGPKSMQHPYVIAFSIPEGSYRFAEKGGILKWLKEQAPFNRNVKKIWVCSKFQNEYDIPQHPSWVVNCTVPFPRIEGFFNRAGFVLYGGSFVLLSILLSIFGAWQAAILLADLLDAAYFRRINKTYLIGVASFLGDMPNRYLWICEAEYSGVLTPLIYFASSYTPFSYKSVEVSEDIMIHELLANHWILNWHHTQKVADGFSQLLENIPISKGMRSHNNVGAFDMVSDGKTLSSLPKRSLAIFDVEPCYSPTREVRHGYIELCYQESKILLFWKELNELAEDLDLVLVHKVKRRSPSTKFTRYLDLLKKLKLEGRYMQLSPDTSVMLLLKKTSASVSLPFTSVCDIAQELKRPAIYFDSVGTIPNPERHSYGTPVAQGKEELKEWLIKQFGFKKNCKMA